MQIKNLELLFNSNSILCIVAETSGSCPGRVGFKMTVPTEGACLGSVGGGSMEHRVITVARLMLETGEAKPALITFEHSNNSETENKSGMICSGSQKIVLIPVSRVKQNPACQKGFLVTENGFQFLEQPPSRSGFTVMGEFWEYAEEITFPPSVYIFGGGHCSLALTPVLNSLDMNVIIIDDREHVWTMSENTAAADRIIRNYSDVSSIVPGDGTALVVIMTASHRSDSTVLAQMLPKKLKYLGMMASRATAKHILDEMRNLGFSDEELNRIHTPIGIPISSQTPAEIAISISAQIVQVLNTL
jgi:xanthine dehydrogenase accessory factor